MPFGPKSSPSTLDMALDILLIGVCMQHLLAYLYDVIIFSTSVGEQFLMLMNSYPC